jgi:hypothetical protein
VQFLHYANRRAVGVLARLRIWGADVRIVPGAPKCGGHLMNSRQRDVSMISRRHGGEDGPLSCRWRQCHRSTGRPNQLRRGCRVRNAVRRRGTCPSSRRPERSADRRFDRWSHPWRRAVSNPSSRRCAPNTAPTYDRYPTYDGIRLQLPDVGTETMTMIGATAPTTATIRIGTKPPVQDLDGNE